MAFDSDVFGYKRNPKPRGVFSTEDSKLTFGDVSNPIGYLVQNWRVNYTQQVQELFEIGSNALYWSKGRPAGQGALGRVIGDEDADSPTKGFFPQSAYDICDGGATMVLNAKGGACPGQLEKGVKIRMSGVVVTAIGFQMAINDVRLVENFTWRFAYMELS
jgi:hypothetical protein